MPIMQPLLGLTLKTGNMRVTFKWLILTKLRQQKAGGAGEPQMLVSKAVANTFEEAFFEVYRTSQERTIWAHVTSIVLSESALDQGFQHIFDALTRYYEFRLTPWVFGTTESMEDILSQTGFFAKTSLDTVMHNPMRSYEQSSTIRPIKLQRLAREMFEPSQTTYIPSLAIDQTQWKKNNEDESKLEVNGAFFIQNDHFKGFFTTDQLEGLRWLISDTQRASLVVPDENNTEYVLVIKDPVPRTTPGIKGGNPSFDIVVSMKGYFTNRNENHHLILPQIYKQSIKEVEDEITALYQLGIENNVDFLNLEHQFFRKHPKEWLTLREDGQLFIDEQSLNEITIHLNIKHTGAILNKSLDIKNIK
jgi:Ger(x)C family germination protein